jgi:predicted nucleic acid-binding protein
MVLLIDTNIILDYLLKREPFYNNAKAVMEKMLP